MRFLYADETSQELLLWVILGTGIGQFSTYLITIVPSLLFRCDFYGRRHPPFAAGGRRGKYAIMSE